MSPIVLVWMLGYALASMALGFVLGRESGAKPLKRLRRRRSYKVEAVLWANPKTTRLVVSWHVDWGHYEYRIADLDSRDIGQTVSIGDSLCLVEDAYGSHLVVDAAD